MTSPGEIRDRAIGAFIGLAVGDALGAPVEFMARGTFPPVVGMQDGGPHNLLAGQWTDDMAMAVCLAESLLQDAQLDPADLLRRFVRWYRAGENSCTGKCFDIGNQTAAALREFEETGEQPAFDTDGAGNGSIMRLAPAAVRWAHDPAKAALIAVKQSDATHGNHIVRRTCEDMAEVLCGLIAGGRGAVLKHISPEIRNRGLSRVRSTGYVTHTWEAALWALGKARSFKDTVLLAVNLGDDSDSVGAVAGQLAGAAYGYGDIPEEWLQQLAWHDRLLELAGRLYDAEPRDAAQAPETPGP